MRSLGSATVAGGPVGSNLPTVKELTLDIATDVFMGGRSRTTVLSTRRSSLRSGRRVPPCVLRFQRTRFRAGVQGRRVLDHFFRHLPAARGETEDLFAALCQATTEDGERFSDEDVVNHMIFLMMAAHDTSTITTTAVTYFLAEYPQWQEAAAAEAAAIDDRLPDIRPWRR
jgi:cytochrome P450